PSTGAWIKLQGGDLSLALREAGPGRLSGPGGAVAERIIEAEVASASWTLMHRYQLCHDLLGSVENDADGLALIFAWLRYSAMRQRDWQRNYNTKPRDLSHAQDRLTQRIAGLCRQKAATSPCRRWARMLLATLGRGGDGQRVRDEILQIMHRNHIKE